MTRDDAATARRIVESARYMTLATADADGVPWASPVWYATAGPREFLWVSDPQARHSRNIALRPQVAIVIFDSNAPVGTGQGVYAAALAEQVDAADLDRALERYSRRSLAQGAAAWTRADVDGPARHRLYRAIASELFLGERDVRRPVTLG
jgi:uncharacterized protein YhbP (UPF0306 family)